MTAETNPRPNHSRRSSALALAGCGALLTVGLVLAPLHSEEENPVARVDGVAVPMSEVESAASDELEQLDAQLLQCQSQANQQRHEVIEGATERVVRERLLALEAGTRGTDPEAVAAELQAAVPPVTEEEIGTWFTANEARLGGRSLEELSPQIETFLMRERLVAVEETFFGDLRGRYAVEILLDPFRQPIESAGFPAFGPGDAPVTIVEFSDFQCPYCKRVVPTIERMKAEYGDKVRLVFRQYPLPNHPEAEKAAQASLCAEEQGKFWQMHDLMFAEQGELEVDALREKASRLGLETADFDACLDSDRYKAQVRADLLAGSAAGVTGTPAMFVNGRLVSGAVPFEDLASVIDDELARLD